MQELINFILSNPFATVEQAWRLGHTDISRQGFNALRNRTLAQPDGLKALADYMDGLPADPTLDLHRAKLKAVAGIESRAATEPDMTEAERKKAIVAHWVRLTKDEDYRYVCALGLDDPYIPELVPNRLVLWLDAYEAAVEATAGTPKLMSLLETVSNLMGDLYPLAVALGFRQSTEPVQVDLKRHAWVNNSVIGGVFITPQPDSTQTITPLLPTQAALQPPPEMLAKVEAVISRGDELLKSLG